jgi:SsrA-binding protein
MEKEKSNSIEIRNRRASFDYSFVEEYIAGIILTGSEIKSIRGGKASITESYCYVNNNQLFIKNMYIAEFKQASYNNHEEKRERVLLLKKSELKKISNEMKGQNGMTIIPIKLFINRRGLAKMKIVVAKGKKTHDKRESIKKKDVQRENEQKIKM